MRSVTIQNACVKTLYLRSFDLVKHITRQDGHELPEYSTDFIIHPSALNVNGYNAVYYYDEILRHAKNARNEKLTAVKRFLDPLGMTSVLSVVCRIQVQQYHCHLKQA